MVCAAELLNGNLLRDADFDSLFLCTAFHGSDLASAVREAPLPKIAT